VCFKRTTPATWFASSYVLIARTAAPVVVLPFLNFELPPVKFLVLKTYFEFRYSLFLLDFMELLMLVYFDCATIDFLLYRDFFVDPLT
jgi:hypothetical protein